MNVPVSTPSVFTNNSVQLTKFLHEENQRCHNGQPLVSHLYPHQIEACLRVKEHFENPNNPRTALVVLPTGGGKTGVAVLSAYATNSARVLVITPSLKVSQQIGDAFGAPAGESFLFKVGVAPPTTPDHTVLPNFHVVQRNELADLTSRMKVLRHQLVVTNVHKVGAKGDKSLVTLEDIPKDFDLVIVDEAHHYPAPTWRAFVDHFSSAKRLFLTGTPEYKGGDILENQSACMVYRLSREEAVERGIIRMPRFDEVKLTASDERAAFRQMATKIQGVLLEHDRRTGSWHQAMVLAQTVNMLNGAVTFVEEYNNLLDDPNGQERAVTFVGGDGKHVVKNFQGGNGPEAQFRVLVVVGRLLEGFDHCPVSVVGVARNVRSRVLFEQFVGRAVRRFRDAPDVGEAVVVSHKRFGQQQNFDLIDVMTAEDPLEEDE